MPLLAGLFGRKKKAPPAELTDDSANASKLRLPFSRKKPQQNPAASTTSVASSAFCSTFSTPPRPPYIRTSTSTADTDPDLDQRRLRPPPSKSAIFAAYADPNNALSTRSLPPAPPKKPFFNWSKSVPKHTPETDLTDTSFNLKSFRHVGPSSPASYTSTTTTLLSVPNTPTGASPGPVPIPRPRGTSIESSQRISVAAFREAQARRSTAGSPAPSLRAPSPLQPLYARQAQRRRRSSGLAYSDGSESPENEYDFVDDEEEEEGGETIRGHAGHKARGTKSEVGHGRAQSGLGLLQGERAQSSLGFALGVGGAPRQRASVSTSAVKPSSAARRASGIATRTHPSSVLSPPNPNPTPSSSSSKEHPDASSDSEDDTPLATLVPPRRPGSVLSAHSSVSASSATGRPKPLIDIRELTR
ncbi:hypothetical protein E4T56_gene9088, partial [Termitomyces sp. T112]